MYLQYEPWRLDLEFGKSLERKRRREKNAGFFHHAQILSKVRFRFVHGLIELKFEGEVHSSLIFNLNGESDLEFWKVIFQPKIELLFWWAFLSGLF